MRMIKKLTGCIETIAAIAIFLKFFINISFIRLLIATNIEVLFK